MGFFIRFAINHSPVQRLILHAKKYSLQFGMLETIFWKIAIFELNLLTPTWPAKEQFAI